VVFFIIAVVVLLLDQLSKWAVIENMELSQSIPLIPDWFYFTSHRNPGAAFGILANQRWFFIVTTIIVVIGIIWYLFKINNDPDRRLFAYALSLILGGAVGNFVDRLAYGHVVDFLDFHHGDFYYPIFNIADSAIVLGVSLIFLDTLLVWRKEKKQGYNTSS
jgi:signal peptidase II